MTLPARSAIAVIATLVAVTACSPSRDSRLGHNRPVFSPNGELLSVGGRGDPACPAALNDWWDKIASAHNGVITREVFMADAQTQFDTMDLDHDGFITPSELSDYRATVGEATPDDVPPPGADGLPQTSASSGSGGSRGSYPGGGGRRMGGMAGSDIPRRQSVQIPADVVDPVMSADKNLTFKVGRQEFMAQAVEVFAKLDKNHDGKIGLDEAVDSCPVRP